MWQSPEALGLKEKAVTWPVMGTAELSQDVSLRLFMSSYPQEATGSGKSSD